MSETELRAVDAARVATLAAKIGVSPNALLAIAARIARTPEIPLDEARLGDEIARARDAGATTDAASKLLLLGHGAHAAADLDAALAMIWAGRRGEQA